MTDSMGESSAIVAAAAWSRDLVTGSLGGAIAILAIAWLGYAALQGRLPVREGLRIVIGCFILFGAPLIAEAFTALAHGVTGARQVYAAPSPAQISLPAKPPQFDPYAGASVPNP